MNFDLFVQRETVGLARQFHHAVGIQKMPVGETMLHMLSACHELVKDEKQGSTVVTFSRSKMTKTEFPIAQTMKALAAVSPAVCAAETGMIELSSVHDGYLRTLGAFMKENDVLPKDATSGEVFTTALRFMKYLQNRMIEKQESLGLITPRNSVVVGRVFGDFNFGM